MEQKITQFFIKNGKKWSLGTQNLYFDRENAFKSILERSWGCFAETNYAITVQFIYYYQEVVESRNKPEEKFEKN